MADRNGIIEKIKALLAKTTSNGATEAEMMAALDKAAAMRDSYEITDAELQLTKDEAAVLQTDGPDEQDPRGIKWRLGYGISQFRNVQIFRKRHQKGLSYIGMPSDAQLAAWMIDHLADFVHDQLWTHLIGGLASRGERQIIIRSFVDACCERINDRLVELVMRSRKACTSNGRELVVVKDAAIKAFMKEHDIHLRKYSGYSSSNVDTAAQAAGRAAGDRANFGRPVSGAAGVLRLGRS
jgi:hypothetical protein